jgi:hypothetical protein
LLVLRLLENPGVTAILGLVVGALLSIEDEEAQKAREEAFEKAKDLYGDLLMLASGEVAQAAFTALEKTYQGVSQMNEALMNDAANARREFIYAARKELGGDTLPFESHKALEQASRQHQRKFWGT